MSKKMLIDAAHPEEVRVAVVSQNKIEDFDFESASRKPLRGNIFLARVTRVEPSLQAAFVDYGGNRHGFLAFSEIHPDYYQIPVSDRNLLQEAEQEVAELAAELELSQRGDEEDDEDGHGDSHDEGGDADHGNDDHGNGDEPHAASGDGDVSDDAAAKDDAAIVEDPPADDQPAERRDASEEEEEEEADEDDEQSAAGDSDDKDAPPAQAGAADDTQPEASDDSSGDDNDHGDAARAAADDDSDNQDEDTDASADADLRADGGADEDSNDDSDTVSDGGEDNGGGDNGKDDNSKSARATRNALFERYKNAKRKRTNLLRNYKIQEVIKRRQILLIQVVKEERGNKGAALTTYLSLAGRYCVLMPNTARGGGISRKIANGSDRRRLRRVVDSLEVPRGMGLIIRTAGAKRTKIEIKRDYEYSLRLWENIRSLTLKSIAPCLIYEEASLIKRAIRDLYDKDISKVYVEGEEGYREAKDFMKMLMPSHAKNVQPYKDRAPIFLKNGVETQLDGMYHPSVRLKSGGYIVIHQTEALVAIDVNSGRATRERNIEQTALKTNVEAAEEAARQFRLRDLAGLIVIDFIDMEEPRNNRKVERALKDAMKADRARVQVGRISSFGLLELSRQRRRSGIVDGTTQTCPTCSGAGVIRSHNMAALRILRAIEGEAIAGKVGTICVRTSIEVSLHVLNHHRDWINRIEASNGVSIEIVADSKKHGDDYDLETSGAPREVQIDTTVIRADQTDPIEIDEPETDSTHANDAEARDSDDGDEKPKKRRRRRRSRRDRDEADQSETAADSGSEEKSADTQTPSDEDGEDKPKKRRRRGRRGGRRNRRDASTEGENAEAVTADGERAEITPAGESADAHTGDVDASPGEQKSEAADTPPEAAAAVNEPVAEDAPEKRDAEPARAKRPRRKRKAAPSAEAAPEAPGPETLEPQTPEPETPSQPDPAPDSAPDPSQAAGVEETPAPQKRTRRGWWHRSAS